MATKELDDTIVTRRTASLETRVPARTLLAALAVTVLTVVLLVPGTTEAGAPMDEGAVLAYSDRVLEGAVPHRDFLSFYGPGNMWAVAAAFSVFGVSIATERGVAVLYRILVVLSVFVLARRVAGTGSALAAGAIAALTMSSELVWAYAMYGALAFGLVGLALAASAVASAPGRRPHLLILGAGAAGGVAVLMRFDLAPAIMLSALPLLHLVGWRSRAWYGLGFVGVAGLYVPHLAMVGPERVERVARDLIASGPGRALPVPQLWAYPGSLLAAAALVTVLFVVAGAVSIRREPTLPGRIILSCGLLSVGLLPYVLSRADVTHIEPVAIVPLSLFPAFALWVMRSVQLRKRARIVTTVAVLGVAVAMVTERGIRFERFQPPSVGNSTRTFYESSPKSASSVQAIITRLDRDARAGESLFVGPQDLRRTNYGPTYVYYLLPKLEPASYYMEMNPQTANREGSGLADDLREADWLVLTTEWDNWDEPNESDRLGSSEPNAVVRDLFCQRLEAGNYRLYERCDR